jgi:hypothetical protein
VSAEKQYLTPASMVVIALIVLLYSVKISPASDDDGRYAQSPNHDWVKSLHSPAGMWCCDISDGRALVDADWRSHDGHYQVRLREDWIDVPEDAVITEPNRIGQTIVWFGYRDGNPIVNCFLPGSMT